MPTNCSGILIGGVRRVGGDDGGCGGHGGEASKDSGRPEDDRQARGRYARAAWRGIGLEQGRGNAEAGGIVLGDNLRRSGNG